MLNVSTYGIRALKGTNINADSANINGCVDAIFADKSATINAASSIISNVSNYGVQAISSIVNINNANISSVLRPVIAQQGARISMTSAVTSTVSSAFDIYSETGSQISADSTVGATSIAINTLTGDGIIFR